MVITDCSVKDKLKKVQFFQETFLLANIGLEVVLGILFLTFSRADIWFTEQEFVWKICMAVEVLPTIKGVEIIDKKKFAIVALSANNKIFVRHVAALAELITILIYLFC